MLDPKLIRTDLNDVAEQLKKRNFALDVAALEKLESRRKACQIETENYQNERNTKSKSIGKAKAAGEDIQPLLDEVAGLNRVKRIRIDTFGVGVEDEDLFGRFMRELAERNTGRFTEVR